jgi:hypothetical protein
LISGATLTDATVDGRPLPLAVEGNTHSAVLPGPAPFAVTLEWAAPLAFTPGRASFTLPVPPAGTARATIDLPGEQADVHVSPGVVTRRAAAGGRTIVDVTLVSGTASAISWSMRDSAPVASAREVRMLADVLTLVTLGESDLRMTTLVDVTVAQGEPRTIEVRLPSGYELSAISGSVIESSEKRDRAVVLAVGDPAVRRHQFLLSLERAHAGGSFNTDTDFVSLPGVQRERGEIAIEGVGTLELNATEQDGMHRIDVRELNAALQSLARLPLLSAFRYQRSAAQPVALAMAVQRFPDAGVLAAVADRATATTMVTVEGRALTEIVLHVRNRAQPFVKVTLPAGATIVSVDVAGEAAKPVVGSDGTRVPLLRPGYRPTGVYDVSYVCVHAGTPFARKGELEMALPKMDIPVGLVEWELFVPDAYTARIVDGNVIERSLAYVPGGVGVGIAGGTGGGVGAGYASGKAGGIVGGLEERIAMPSTAETVTVVGASQPAPPPPAAAPREAPRVEPPSQIVVNLQRRAAGVLPIRIDVPRAGTSHQFVKPLVIEDAVAVRLKYKRR